MGYGYTSYMRSEVMLSESLLQDLCRRYRECYSIPEVIPSEDSARARDSFLMLFNPLFPGLHVNPPAASLTFQQLASHLRDNVSEDRLYDSFRGALLDKCIQVLLSQDIMVEMGMPESTQIPVQGILKDIALSSCYSFSGGGNDRHPAWIILEWRLENNLL